MSQMGKTEQSKLFDSKIQPPPLNNHRYIDKNIHETIERIQSYEIHQKKLVKIREELEKNRQKKANGDNSYHNLKSQMINNKLRSHEFTETEKINEIKRSNQILLDKLLDISKGKRCEVKQENISTILPQSKSLNYQVKKKEAERIDYENQKIMERIVNQNASLSSKKMHQDYIEQLKYKKMKQQKMGLSIDKILEKKRKMVLEARSTILPLLNTKQSIIQQADDTVDVLGRNYNMGGSIDAQSQRVNHNISQDVINIGINYDQPLITADYNNNYSSAQNNNNRYENKSHLAQLSHSVTPKNQRQKRYIAKSEMTDYKEGALTLQQTSNNNRKPNKIVLESINNKQAKNASITTSIQNKQNKPPVAPITTNQQKTLQSNNQQNTANMKKPIEPVLKSIPGDSYYTHSQVKTQPPQQTQLINKQNNQSNKSSASQDGQLPTPKVNMNPNMIMKSNSNDSYSESKQTLNSQQKQMSVANRNDESIDDDIIDEEVNQVNTQAKNKQTESKQGGQSDIDDYEEDKIIEYFNKDQSATNSKINVNAVQQLKVSSTAYNNNDFSVNSSKYIERNSILSKNDNSFNNNKSMNTHEDKNKIQKVVKDQQIKDDDYEEEFEEEFVE